MSSRDTAPKKKSRPRIALEPISMDEILGAPGMSGFVSILDPREQVPHLQALVDDIREVPQPKPLPEESKESSPQTPAEAPKDPETPPRRSGATVIHFQRATEPLREPAPKEVEETLASPGAESPAEAGIEADKQKDTGAQRAPESKRVPEVERDTRSLPPIRSPRSHIIDGHYVRRAVLAQDGHSSGEEVLYQALWNSRYAQPETRETRLVTIGWKAMAKLARLTPRNTKRNCQSLIQKLAIEQLSDENSRESIGRTYRLYSYKAILERRRAAGMEWITRSRGVAFVEQPAGADLPRLPAKPPGFALRDTVSQSAPGAKREPEPKRDSGVERDTGSKKDTGSAIDPPPITGLVRTLREYLTDVDDASVAGLLEACRKVAPDATEDEITHFVRLKADLMYRMGNVKSPMGFLRTAVPRCFEGESFRQHREAETERRSATAREEQRREEEVRQFRAEQQAIADDPKASAEDRRFARQYLGIE